MANEQGVRGRPNAPTHYACEAPERMPTPDVTFFHTTRPCRGCAIAAEAAARNFPGHRNRKGTTIEQIAARTKELLDV